MHSMNDIYKDTLTSNKKDNIMRRFNIFQKDNEKSIKQQTLPKLFFAIYFPVLRFTWLLCCDFQNLRKKVLKKLFYLQHIETASDQRRGLTLS